VVVVVVVVVFPEYIHWRLLSKGIYYLCDDQVA
jgi:hypothetical protein